jgi:hypothetical protein
MKCGARIALGVAGGYLLGRSKKMKLALTLAGVAAGRQAGGPRGLLSQGAKLLGDQAEVGRLTEEIRGRLITAGKDAALAVATRQLDTLAERVGTRIESLGEQRGGGRRRERQSEEPDVDRAESDDLDEPEPDENVEDRDEQLDDEDRARDEEEPEGDETEQIKRTAPRGERRAAERPAPRPDRRVSSRAGAGTARGGRRSMATERTDNG